MPGMGMGMGMGHGGGGAGGDRFGLYVGNVDASISLDQLRAIFSKYGQIVGAALNGRDTDPFRYAFIDFANEADRNKAMGVNGFQLAGRALKVGTSKGIAPRGTMQVQDADGNNLGGRPPRPAGFGMGAGPMGAFRPPSVNEAMSDEELKLKELQKKQYYEQSQNLAGEYQSWLEKQNRRARSEDSADDRGRRRSRSRDGASRTPSEKRHKSEKKEKRDKHDKSDKKDKHDKRDKSDKKEKSEKREKRDKSEKKEKRDKSDKKDKHDKKDKSDKKEKRGSSEGRGRSSDRSAGSAASRSPDRGAPAGEGVPQ